MFFGHICTCMWLCRGPKRCISCLPLLAGALSSYMLWVGSLRPVQEFAVSSACPMAENGGELIQMDVHISGS